MTADVSQDDVGLDLLDVVWGSTPGSWSTLSHLDANGRLVHTAVRTDDRDAWARWTAEHRHGDCWFRVCPMAAEPDLPGHRGTAAATSAVPELFGDFDVESAKHPKAPPREIVAAGLRQLHEAIPLSVVVNTGNGWQVHVLHEPADPAVAIRLKVRWEKLLRTLGLTNDRTDLASILRLPGTVNTEGGHTVTMTVQGVRYSLAELDDLLPELDDGEEPGLPEGVELADEAKVEAFYAEHTEMRYPRALAAAIDGIADTIERQGGARHPTLRLYLWQVLSEAAVGAYPARQAVEEGYEAWKRHLGEGERRPRHERRDLLSWVLPHVLARTDLAELAARLDDVFFEPIFEAGSNTDEPPLRIVEPEEEPVEPAEVMSLAESHKVCRHWLGDDYDLDAWDVTLAAAACEQLDGDPPWVLIVGGSGNAKTETVQAVHTAPRVTVTSTITSPGALLSGTPRREKVKGSTGGLLRKLGDRGVLVIKDVTSILSMNTNTRTEVIAALREIHDGRWERNVGTDGGQTLTWEGRLIVIGAVTTAWDAHHAVVGAMGDRFVLLRLDLTDDGRLAVARRSILNAGAEKQMRADLAAAAAGVLAGIDPTPVELTAEEVEQLVEVADFVTRARTAVETDWRGDPTEPHALEAPTRFVKELVQIARGAAAIGLDRGAVVRLALRCARDSMPPLRLAVLLDLLAHPDSTVSAVARRVERPRSTVSRCLDVLVLLGLVDRTDRPQGLGDLHRLSARVSGKVLSRMSREEEEGG
jgi:hypothetical protein